MGLKMLEGFSSMASAKNLGPENWQLVWACGMLLPSVVVSRKFSQILFTTALIVKHVKSTLTEQAISAKPAARIGWVLSFERSEVRTEMQKYTSQSDNLRPLQPKQGGESRAKSWGYTAGATIVPLKKRSSQFLSHLSLHIFVLCQKGTVALWVPFVSKHHLTRDPLATGSPWRCTTF